MVENLKLNVQFIKSDRPVLCNLINFFESVAFLKVNNTVIPNLLNYSLKVEPIESGNEFIQPDTLTLKIGSKLQLYASNAASAYSG